MQKKYLEIKDYLMERIRSGEYKPEQAIPAERELALFMGMVLLTKCEQVWVFGSVISAGMRAEIAKAEKKNIPVRYFTEELEEMPCAN